MKSVRLRKTNTVWSHLYVESKKNKKQIHRNRDQICGCQKQGGGVGELDEGGQKVQTSGYKINKYWGYNVQYDDYS